MFDFFFFFQFLNFWKKIMSEDEIDSFDGFEILLMLFLNLPSMKKKKQKCVILSRFFGFVNWNLKSNFWVPTNKFFLNSIQFFWIVWKENAKGKKTSMFQNVNFERTMTSYDEGIKSLGMFVCWMMIDFWALIFFYFYVWFSEIYYFFKCEKIE